MNRPTVAFHADDEFSLQYRPYVLYWQWYKDTTAALMKAFAVTNSRVSYAISSEQPVRLVVGWIARGTD